VSQRHTVFVRILLCYTALLAACGTEPSVPAPTASPSSEATAPLSWPALTQTAGATLSATGIVGRWVMLDGGLELEFSPDGQFARHYPADEHQVEYWSIEGSYQLLDGDRVLIELSGEEPATYEYRLGEPWLMLRDQDGQVARYYRR
jgi:hypothetical protein